MSGNRREVNRREITHQIQVEFLSLYAQGGIDRVSIGALCSACEIARSTFYYYFDDKYKVLESIEDELISALWDINYPGQWNIDAVMAGKPLEEVIETLCYIEQNRQTFQILLGPYGDPRFSFNWKKGIEPQFNVCFESVHGQGKSSEVACTVFTSALMGLFTKYVFQASDFSRQAFSIVLGNLLRSCLFDYFPST